MKPVRFLGDWRARLATFPEGARSRAGRQLFALQCGLAPTDSKFLSTLGAGVEEIRIWDATGTYRVIYVARFEEALYVLHVFQTKTQQTSSRDVEVIERRFAEMRRLRERM